MKISLKTRTSLILLTVLGLTLVTDANAGRTDVGTEKQIQTCVEEIAKHADYDGALKVMHWVSQLDQRNPVELEIRVETSVYVSDAKDKARKYTVVCLTGTLGALVRFRIDAGERLFHRDSNPNT